MQFTVVKKKFLFILNTNGDTALKTSLGRKSDFGKSEKNAAKVTAPKIAKRP